MRGKISARVPMTSSMLSCFSFVLCPQLLSWGNMDAPALLAEVTQAQEVIAAAKAACATVVLAVETFAREAAVAQDSVTVCVKDIEDWAAQEQLCRVEVEKATVLASVR
jgi:hypothetical protein